MPTRQEFEDHFIARRQGEPLSNADVDAWELKAAKRCLANLKHLLEGQPMMDVLAEQIEEADRFHKAILDASGGRWRDSRIDLHIAGIGAEELNRRMGPVFAGMPQTSFLALHLEHYVIPPSYGAAGMVETIGGLPTRFKGTLGMRVADLPPAVQKLIDPGYPIVLTGMLLLDDGTPFAYGMHQIRDTEDGCDFALRIVYGAAVPDEMIREHAEHLAIEFRAFLRAVFDQN